MMATDSEYYVYEGEQVVLDLAGSGAIRREYAWNPGAIDRLLAMRSAAPADTFAAVLDPRIRTVRGLARFRTGALVKRYPEGPWGDVAADTGIVVRYRFAGRERDSESGLYYMRARYYDAALGRWVNEDPIGVLGGGNLYRYAAGDPVNRDDLLGLMDPCFGRFPSDYLDSEPDPDPGSGVVVLPTIEVTAEGPNCASVPSTAATFIGRQSGLPPDGSMPNNKGRRRGNVFDAGFDRALADMDDKAQQGGYGQCVAFKTAAAVVSGARSGFKSGVVVGAAVGVGASAAGMVVGAIATGPAAPIGAAVGAVGGGVAGTAVGVGVGVGIGVTAGGLGGLALGFLDAALFGCF